MSCLNPITIRLYSGTDKECYQRVRCRQCEDCKQSMRSAAFVRLYSEYKHAVKNNGIVLFFTLTFADEYLPFKFHRMCFDKRLVQEWLQNIRQDFRRHFGKSLKLFLVSELGHVGTHRPHHHGLMFLYPDDKYQLKSWKSGKHSKDVPFLPHSYARLVSQMWKYGRADVSEFDPSKGGIQYVAKYISKFDEEEKLFKDIITRIQIKRGKGNPDKAVKYYSDTFPSLHAFMQRYCPFTMISKGLGDSLDICEDCLISQQPIFIDGFQYNIPRYYSDRYVRKEIKNAQQFVIHDSELSDCDNNVCYLKRYNCLSYLHIKTDNEDYLQPFYKMELHPADLDCPNTRPSDCILERYKNFIDAVGNYQYGPMPYYALRFTYGGKPMLKQVYPKQSDVSTLSKKRKEYKFLHILEHIENAYYNLPTLLQDSCSYDIPKILRDTKSFISGVEFELTEFGLSVLDELDELSRVNSDWRARSRLDKMEQKRKLKESRNTPYAKKRLSWDEYRVKSRYLSHSQKFKM